MSRLIVLLLIIVFSFFTSSAQIVWLDELDLASMDVGWASPQANRSVDGNPLKIAGTTYDRGVGTHSVSTYLLFLDGSGKRFSAIVGVDDEANEKGSVEFLVLGDKKILWRSGIMKKGEPAKRCDVACDGMKLLGLLVTDAGDGIDYDHADWVNAQIELRVPKTGEEFLSIPGRTNDAAYILTPRPSDRPRINSPKAFGVRPGHPFLYTIAATGGRPMKFQAENLPRGLFIDESTGQITGIVRERGTYRVTLKAANALGEATRELRIEAGDRIALTPPMGWNSWNCWACAVDDEKVRASADALVSSGLVDHGWTYINIDDCWEIKPGAKEANVAGEPRESNGMIRTNAKFPDMKALSNYVHSKGLKIGIYSSPGPLTCAGFTASYQFEEHDARRYADWGIDYLKYDWCSYGKIAPIPTLDDFKKPYRVMRAALDNVERDIVYSLCQYGMGKVWEWGDEVGGNCWRTTGDIIDTWSSMAGIGFGQVGREAYAKPGNWNDPDMLVVGLVGWGPNLHPSRLTPDEQYTHISLWCLLASPLLIGCDLSRLDDFTRNLLTNDEVLEVNQDPLGNQARRIQNSDGVQVWIKDMEDGSKAVGLFNVGKTSNDPIEMFNWEGKRAAKATISSVELGLAGPMKIRDLWRQKELGRFSESYTTEIPYHGVILLRIWP